MTATAERYLVRLGDHDLYAATGPDWAPAGHEGVIHFDTREEATGYARRNTWEAGVRVVPEQQDARPERPQDAPQHPPCPHCRGAGEVGVWVEWSDGVGGSTARCPLCEGRKVLDFDPCAELVKLRQQLLAFCYPVWLIAGCYPTMHEVSGLEPHEQGIRNKVLRMLMEFPQAERAGCDLKKPDHIAAKERDIEAAQRAERERWRQERDRRRRR